MWRPEGWNNLHIGVKYYMTREQIYEAGADAMLKEVHKAITDAEFCSLVSLGLSEFTEEQVKCFISYLRQYLGRKGKDVEEQQTR